MSDSKPHKEKISQRGASGEGATAENAPHFPQVKDFDMRIARDGTWYYRGTPINRPKLVALFSTVLKRDDDGVFWLETPVEKGRIDVEDAPFVAVEMRAASAGRSREIDLRTNIGSWIPAGPAHPIRVEEAENREPSPYILVRDRLEALIQRPVFYHLVELAEPNPNNENELGVWSRGRFFPLGRTS
jgi:hypothetical protein